MCYKHLVLTYDLLLDNLQVATYFSLPKADNCLALQCKCQHKWKCCYKTANSDFPKIPKWEPTARALPNSANFSKFYAVT